MDKLLQGNMTEEFKNQPIEETQQQQETTTKKKRQVSPEQKANMLEILEKTRFARAANQKNVTKYPKAKRERAQEMYQVDIEKKAEGKARLLAEELLRKKEEQAELEQFRKWKQSQSQSKEPKESLPEEPEPKPKKKPSKKTPEIPKKTLQQPSAKNAPKTSKSSATRKKSTKGQQEQEMETPLYTLSDDYYGSSQATFNIDDFLH